MVSGYDPFTYVLRSGQATAWWSWFGLEPTTRVLWNMGVSDSSTRSDTHALEL